jgi:DNA-binding LacI/PurR family transcriptional regulator
MMLIDDHGLPEEERAAAESFVAFRVAGVVGTPVSSQLTDFLSSQRTPVVEVDRQFAEGESDAVIIDNRAAARMAIEHLTALGHSRIALLIDETDWTTGRDRLAGYTDALIAAGIALDDSLIVPAGWDVDAAWRAATRLLSGRNGPTAIFAANNVLSEGAWRAARALGLAVPRELSFVSFDDAPWMSMVSPGVTAVVHDAQVLGATAVATVLDRIADPDTPPRQVVLPVHLVHRGSTGPPVA